jgi:hypothetical protein
MRKDDVIAALNKLGVHARCYVCNANDWGGLGPGGEYGAHVQAIDPDGQITPGAGIECGVLVCNRCGYVRLHADLPLKVL